MLMTCVGLPSGFSYACQRIIGEIARSAFGSYASLYAVFVEDLKKKWADLDRDATQPVFFFSDFVTPDLARILLQVRAPIVVTGDSFVHLVCYIMRARRSDFEAAIRFGSQAACLMEQCSGATNIMRITARQAEQPLDFVVEALLRFYGLALSDTSFDQLISHLSEGIVAARPTLRDFIDLHFPDSRAIEEVAASLSQRERQMLSALAQAYDDLALGKPPHRVSWPVDLFKLQEPPHAPPREAIELVGPARLLIFGPYMHLPAGRWYVEATLQTEQCLSDNHLLVDVYAQQVLAHARTILPASGQFAFDLHFTITDPFLPIEVRFHLANGAIEGRFKFISLHCLRE